MKNNFLKKTAAGLLALLIVAGATPAAPFSKISERTAITANALRGGDVVDSGTCGKTEADHVTWELTPIENAAMIQWRVTI